MPCYITVGHLAVTQALHSGKLSENVVDLSHPRHARFQRTRSSAALNTMVIDPSSWRAGRSATGGSVAGMPAIAPYAKADLPQLHAAHTTPFSGPSQGECLRCRECLRTLGHVCG